MPNEITVYEASTPFTLRGEAPDYHASTDALCGTYRWTEDRTWESAEDAARDAESMGADSDAEYAVVDSSGRLVTWPEQSCALPADWWLGGKERANGCPEEYVGF